MSDTWVKHAPFGQYEFVDVQFGAANQPITVTYERLRVEDPSEVCWMDTQPGGLSDGTVAVIYRLVQSAENQGVPGQIILRCTVANYRTRVLLYTERN